MSYRTTVRLLSAAVLLVAGCGDDTQPEEALADDEAVVETDPDAVGADEDDVAEMVDDDEGAADPPGEEAEPVGAEEAPTADILEIDACGLLTNEEAAALAGVDTVEDGRDGLFQSDVVTSCTWPGGAQLRVELHSEARAGTMPDDWEDDEGGFIRVEPVDGLGPGAHLLIGGADGSETTDVHGLTVWSGGVGVHVSAGFPTRTDEIVNRHVEAARAALGRL